MSDKLLYRISEATAATGISRSKLYELMADGAIASVKVGSSRFITREALESFIAGLPSADDRAPDAAA